MLSLNFLSLYVSTVFIASIIPGPSMLLALTHGMQFGARRTIVSAMGNLSVTVVQAIVSIAGLGAILAASEIAFNAIKYAGAAYLICMGIGIISSPKMSLAAPTTRHGNKVSSYKMYSQAAMVTAGNPKAIVFFTAIFPQFINPDAAYLPQSCLLISLGALIAFSCFMIYAVCGQKIVSLLSSASAWKQVNKILGGTFIGSGVFLAVSKR